MTIRGINGIVITTYRTTGRTRLGGVGFVGYGTRCLPYCVPTNDMAALCLGFDYPFPGGGCTGRHLARPGFLGVCGRLLTPNTPVYRGASGVRFFRFSLRDFSRYNFELSGVDLSLRTDSFRRGVIARCRGQFSSVKVPVCHLRTELWLGTRRGLVGSRGRKL